MKFILSLITLFFPLICFALPDCPADRTERYHNCFGIYLWPDGDKYVGEWNDNKKHGQGIYTSPDGYKYVGHMGARQKHTLSFS